MSYDIYLNDPVTGETIEFDAPHQMKGGTYEAGGSRQAWLNVTYNYAGIYGKVFPDKTGEHPWGIRTLYGMTGAESIPILEKAIDALKWDVDDDYWKATEGNARRALTHLLAFAQMRPDGVWSGD